MELKIYNSKAKVAESFSEYLKALIQSNAVTHIALSGGSTPKIVFEYISDNFKNDIDWSTVHFYWGDERCVAPSHEESNYKMTVDYLLSNISIPAGNIHRVKGEDIPENEAVRYSAVLDKELPKLNDIPQFDLVMLGMGDDGHTASIFPHEIQLWNADTNCEVAIHPDSEQRRITITGKLINNAKEVAFLVTGAGKSEKMREIIKTDATAPKYPASLVVPTSGKLLWFLDADAAAEL
ncbi:MAG: 6-phosphogluconolactonase [Flavobacteriaceae bacterium]|nr:MAG: 6-phosphogluconolactonase [Flavobacteriaceae bacterium]